MTDSLTLVNSHSPGQVARKDVYESDALREIRAHASTVSHGESTEERRSLRRLNQALDQDQPPRNNVPRGFYLNIEV